MNLQDRATLDRCTGGGEVNVHRSGGRLSYYNSFLGRGAPLSETLEAFERVVDEHPIFVRYLTLLGNGR